MLKLLFFFLLYVLFTRQVAYKIPYRIAQEEMRKHKLYHDWLEFVFFIIAMLIGFIVNFLVFSPAVEYASREGIKGFPFIVYKFMDVGCFGAPIIFSGWCAITVSQEIAPNCED